MSDLMKTARAMFEEIWSRPRFGFSAKMSADLEEKCAAWRQQMRAAEVANEQRQAAITELWNAIDKLPEPEPFWRLLCAICPDAFDDPRDPNTIRFKYVETI
jgi:hypothetical protein